jgi:hypothetical protein
MDRPPAPMLADYAAEVESGRLWVTRRRTEDGYQRVYMEKHLR